MKFLILKENKSSTMLLRILLILSQIIFFFELDGIQGEYFECSENITRILKSIPEEDRKILHDFFHNLYVEGDFAYTLFGPKPMAIIDHNLEYNIRSNSKKAKRSAEINRKGWDIWKRYRDLFPISQFIFVSNEVPDRNGCFSIAVISKPKCLDLINQYIYLFQETFEGVTCEKILESMIQQCMSGSIFNKDHFPQYYYQCLGILLGYGQSNALAFEERLHTKNMLALAPIDFSNYATKTAKYLKQTIPLNVNHIHLPNRCYTLKADELLLKFDQTENQLIYAEATKRPNPLYPIRTPGFMSLKNNSETETIQIIFDKSREKILNVFYEDQFLEIILTQLTE